MTRTPCASSAYYSEIVLSRKHYGRNIHHNTEIVLSRKHYGRNIHHNNLFSQDGLRAKITDIIAGVRPTAIEAMWTAILGCARNTLVLRRMLPSGIWRRSALVRRTHVSEKHIPSVFWVARLLTLPSSQRGCASRRTGKRASYNGTSTLYIRNRRVTVDGPLLRGIRHA
jgi:hypothetical protein